METKYDSIMASVTVMHADQFFKTLIDTEELPSLDLRIGDDVIVGVTSFDVILLCLNFALTLSLNEHMKHNNSFANSSAIKNTGNAFSPFYT